MMLWLVTFNECLDGLAARQDVLRVPRRVTLHKDHDIGEPIPMRYKEPQIAIRFLATAAGHTHHRPSVPCTRTNL